MLSKQSYTFKRILYSEIKFFLTFKIIMCLFLHGTMVNDIKNSQLATLCGSPNKCLRFCWLVKPKCLI